MSQMVLSFRREMLFASRALAVFFVLLTAFVVGPTIERWAWSPVHNYRMLESRMEEDGSVQFRFMWERTRECRTVSVTWFRYGDGFYAPAMITPLPGEVARNRPIGLNLSIWWVASGPGTYALQTTFDCGFPWTTAPEPFRFTLP